ncbi:MAG: cysteine--tRNA ligase [Gemmatimonadetes bacterium]|nr:cysteine--tRNA ligase [Gemmatimonadota bacterium]
MALRFFNTLTRRVEPFEPLQPGRVLVYACGPTVYRPPHIGNYRTFVFNDVLHRYLEWKGCAVRFVMNLTDVEDKIIDAAGKAGVRVGEITAPQIHAFFEDLERLGIRPADEYPRATNFMPEMIALIGRLLERGHAYTQNGSVYFDISSFPPYGRLNRLELVETRPGAGLAGRRSAVDADEYEKEDARDFALWKAAKAVDRETGATWPTPWGEGRPGWHIECSAMSMKLLGESFDIHTGGEDLIFPHHEDEIAQSEAATGKPFVKTWLHVTHLKVNGEKMSKSLGNDFTIGDLLERGYRPAEMRLLMLQAHYRKELNFSFDGLAQARTAVGRIADLDRRLNETTAEAAAPESGLSGIASSALEAFEQALDDDLNTPNALAVLFPFINVVNAALDRSARVHAGDLVAARHALDRMDAVLGILDLVERDDAVDPAFAGWVDDLLAQRAAARGRRDFAAADRIRAELAAAGVVVDDTPGGVRWKRV